MVKKSIMIFTILAMLAFGVCTCWSYTASKWPVPGIPNEVFTPGPAVLGNAGYGGYGAYSGYGVYGGHGAYGWYGNRGYYGGYGTGFYGQGWRR